MVAFIPMELSATPSPKNMCLSLLLKQGDGRTNVRDHSPTFSISFPQQQRGF
jgi:hypothetical protein